MTYDEASAIVAEYNGIGPLNAAYVHDCAGGLFAAVVATETTTVHDEDIMLFVASNEDGLVVTWFDVPCVGAVDLATFEAGKVDVDDVMVTHMLAPAELDAVAALMVHEVRCLRVRSAGRS